MSINFKTIAISAIIAAIAAIMGFAGFFETAIYAQGNTTGVNATRNATTAGGAEAASLGCSHHKPTNQGTSNSATANHAVIYIWTAGMPSLPWLPESAVTSSSQISSVDVSSKLLNVGCCPCGPPL